MAEKYRVCNETCPDYYSSKALTNLNLCNRDDKVVIFPDCRFKLPPLAQSSAKGMPRKRIAVSLTEQIENIVEDFKKQKAEHLDPRFPGVTVFYD